MNTASAAQHTKGPVEWYHVGLIPGDGCLRLDAADGTNILITDMTDEALKYDPLPSEADQDLIRDAFNVASESGCTPRQLLAQRDALLAALRALVAEQECATLPLGARCPRVKCAACDARAALAATAR